MSGTIESGIASVANKFAYGGAATAVVASWSGADIVTAVGGLAIGLLGFGVSLYYRRKADARATAAAAVAELRQAQEHQARMDLYAHGSDPHGE